LQHIRVVAVCTAFATPRRPVSLLDNCAVEITTEGHGAHGVNAGRHPIGCGCPQIGR
jgi:hypothetical protein